MSLLNKILIILGSLLLIIGLGFIIFKQHEIAKRQEAIETQISQQKEIADNIMRSQSKFSTKEDLENFVTQNNLNLKAIKEDLDKLNARLVFANTFASNSKGQVSSNLPSTSTGSNNPEPEKLTCDPHNYMKLEQKLSLNEKFSNTEVPFGEVGFSAWQSKPWSVNIKPREYRSANVVGTDENEKVYVYNKFSVVVDHKEYDVKISKAETKQEYPEAKFSFFNPKVFLSTGVAVNVSQAPVKGSVNLGATVGFMSYGKSKLNPDLSILQLGAGYETGTQLPSLVVKPINVNIGNLLSTKVISNTYLGPSFQIDSKQNVFIGAGLSVGL